ncbi:hypothetical protein Poli38472_010616 [Pythium oligandrum]|uniref:Uncharacterized protein n=1 Tax=Pythium oligandrum TaxID=41045 RepID=A0A8K1C3C6_PYTOL|nr:hypothetical protein Poli38472_010616 [Pythium oligandrum]|eukprot:TMW55734.1 hypothetical protein Poli38472_010616 [Pythium oligandrum]
MPADDASVSPSPSASSAATTTKTPAELSPNQFKLLYLISLYAVAANSTKQNERWMRQVPLLVLMYEGIISGVFDFDYAPASVRLSFTGRTLRRWVNFSQEGNTAINDLWEMQLVNGLKLSSDDFQPITAFQVSLLGLERLHKLPSAFRDEVDRFIYPPSTYDHKLLQVAYDGTRFLLRSGAYSRKSTITESEDVSYVSSPFLPNCLRARGYYRLEMHSNQHRASECAVGMSNINKNTSEAITLGDVSALVGEWAPFGSNQIVALNERMGALDRCQGGILTSFVDQAPTDTQFKVPIGQTQVRILDYDFVRFINFEAESHFPETSGIVQVEHFGMHLNCDGSLIYGIKVEAILDRKNDDISIDHLARLLVDLHQDSSMLVNDLLSRYQVSLLEMLYLGDSFQRNKYNCILAKQMQPKLPAQEYMNNPLYANELAQVLGDLQKAYDLSPDDVLIVGKAGCLLSGPHIFRFEHVLTKYLGLVCRDMFIRNFFARTFVLDATLKEIRQMLHLVHVEPGTALKVREKLAVVSKDTILLAETLEYLLDSLEDLQLNTVCSRGSFLGQESDAEIESKLTGVLALQPLKAQTIMRCHDSIKLMENTMLQLEQLQMISESTATTLLERACQRVHLNTRDLLNATAEHQRVQLTLKAMQYVVSGSFVFDVIDRLLGGTFNVHLPPWAVDYLVTPVLSRPWLWWFLNLLVYAICLWLLHKVSLAVARQPLGWCSVKADLGCFISLDKLHLMLQRRSVRKATAIHIAAAPGTASARFRIAFWEEDDAVFWLHTRPLIHLCYDEKHSFALYAVLQFDTKTTSLREHDGLQKLMELLAREGIYGENTSSVCKTG